jgi:uncharacterized repeat protein (TIGR03806 family)
MSLPGQPTTLDLGAIAAPGSVRSFAQDEAGEIYVLADAILRIVPGTGGGGISFPQLLSQTGCFEGQDPTRFVEGVIPYDVNVPFWSDGLSKQRGLALPDGTTIDVDAEGDFSVPPGSVLIKNFRFGGRLVETRLLVRHDDGEFAGYSYEWNDFETEAILLEESKLHDVGGQSWLFPSAAQCSQCHTSAAGGSLSLEIPQLNRDFMYPRTGLTANQLETFEHIGLLSAPLGQPPEALDAFPASSETGALLDLRARAYLHANCSQCHRPGTGVQSTLDFRAATRWDDLEACNVAPTHGDLGIPGARLLTPGDPATSLISLRMATEDPEKMPPVGRLVLDLQGIALIDSWVASWLEGEGVCLGPDSDADGLVDQGDNCPRVSNALQVDSDGDGIGDGCGPCGDAILDPPAEQCDDGDQIDGDGCSRECLLERPDLITVVVAAPDTADPGDLVALGATVANQGPITSGGVSTLSFYLSTSGSVSSGDTLVSQCSVQSLAPSAEDPCFTINAQIPMDAAPGGGAVYTWVGCADDLAEIDEVDEANNCVAGPTIIVPEPSVPWLVLTGAMGLASVGTRRRRERCRSWQAGVGGAISS